MKIEKIDCLNLIYLESIVSCISNLDTTDIGACEASVVEFIKILEGVGLPNKN